VISEMLKIYQEILSLKFVKDEELSKTAWAPGIDAYRVRRRDGPRRGRGGRRRPAPVRLALF
jgi:hypothetical protein